MSFKNWSPLRWILTGCLVLGVAVLGFAALLTWFVLSLVKSSGAYTESLALIQSDPAVIERLGKPIEPGFFVLGSTKVKHKLGTEESSGEASITYSLSGPKGSCKAYVDATLVGGTWHFEELSVFNEEWPERLDVAAPAPTQAEEPLELEQEEH